MSDLSKIFLDFASATPISDEVFEAMRPYFQEKFYNPSAVYLDSRSVRHDIDHARHTVAQVIGARSDEVVFTAGATESCNLAIKGIMSQFVGSNMIISSTEHAAVSSVANEFEHKVAGVDHEGILDLADVVKLIDEKTVLVSIIYANNETGVIQDLSKISTHLAQVRLDRSASGNKLPIWLHTDAAQAGNYLDLKVSRLGVDMMTLNGGKMYGPKQSGILYGRSGVILKPQIEGGGQEFGLRSGTENVASIIGFSEALKHAQELRKEESHRLRQLQTKLLTGLKELKSEIVINGSLKKRLPNNVNFSIPGADGERVVMSLDERNVQCATGAACSALSGDSSHVIKALGCTEEEARGSIRISMGRSTTELEIDEFLKRMAEV